MTEKERALKVLAAAAEDYVKCLRKFTLTNAGFERTRSASDVTVRLEATLAHAESNAEACRAELRLVKAMEAVDAVEAMEK